MCYLALFGIFSWDKLYYIITKKGNDPQVYFKYRNIKDLNMTRENFIEVYKRSSNLGKKL